MLEVSKNKKHKEFNIVVQDGFGDSHAGRKPRLAECLMFAANSLGNSIRSFEIENQESGYPGHYVTVKGWCRFFSLCPNLVAISLTSVMDADDEVVEAITRICKGVQSLTICGHDKSNGRRCRRGRCSGLLMKRRCCPSSPT